MKKQYLILVLIVCNIAVVFSSTPSVESIFEALFQKSTEIKRVEMDLITHERIQGEMIKSRNFIKCNADPFQLYVKQHYPTEGLEVLYNSQVDNTKALINTNSFPWVTISLDPLSNMMRKDKHHSIFKSDFGFVISLLQSTCDLYKGRLEEVGSYLGLVKYDDRVCYKVQLEVPQFGFTEYTVKQGETLESLSYKLKVNDFMILEHNPKIKGYQDIHEGDVIKVPNTYAKKIILYVEKERNIIAGLKVYDDKGLYEDYVYQNVILNYKSTDLDFSAENPGYNF